MANNQTKSLKAAVRKAKKIHEGNIVPVWESVPGRKSGKVTDTFREHGPFAFKPDLDAIERKRARRLKAAQQRNKTNLNNVNNFIG